MMTAKVKTLRSYRAMKIKTETPSPSSKMTTISVLGLGNWGTALANHLANKGYPVLGWTIEKEIAEGIEKNHKNPVYQSQATLSPNLRATTTLEECLQNRIVIFVLPSSAMSEVVPRLTLPDRSIFVSAVKGLDKASLLTPLQFAKQHLPSSSSSLCVLSGPSFAKDLVVGRPAGIVSASSDPAVAREIAEVFSNDSLKIYTSGDPLGVELGGIIKNVIALAAGVCDGLELGDSARAGLITRGLAEMMRLAEAMGARGKTLAGLSGLGDLIVTATSSTSRNHTVGERLGKGEELGHIIETLGSTAEGVITTPLVIKLAEKHGVEMPISLAVNRLLDGKSDPKTLVQELISRPLKEEF